MLNSLQKALYNVLEAKAYKVFDNVPEGVTMPYIKLFDTTLEEGKNKVHREYDITQEIHLWLNGTGKGRKEANTMYADILDTILKMPIDLENGYQILDITPKSPSGVNELQVDEVNVVYQGQFTFTFKLIKFN